MNDSRSKGATTVFAAAIAALLLWSGTAIANKVAVVHMSGLTAGVLRSMLAGLFATAIATVARLPFPAGARDRTALALSGVASFAVWPVLLSVGIRRTTAGHAALIMATIPLFTVLIAALAERRSPRTGWWIGAAVAVAGTAALIVSRGVSLDSLEYGSSIPGDLTILAGTVVCAAGYNFGGRLSPKIGTVATTFWGLAAALPVLVPIFLVIAGRTAWNEVPLEAWLAIGWMTFLSSLAGYALWFYALGHGGIGRIGSLQLAMPVITLAAAAILLDESLSASLVASCITIIVGTYLAQRNV